MKKIKSLNVLPDNYQMSYIADLKTNKKLSLWINIGVIFLLIPFVIGMFYLSFEMSLDFIFIILYIIVICLHELIHGIFFKLGTNTKIKYQFHGFAASASAPGIYFYQKHYLLVTIAPTIILNILLTIACFITKDNLFSNFYLVLALHFSGCIGDIFIFFKLLRYKNDTLIEDTGLTIKFYTKYEKNPL